MNKSGEDLDQNCEHWVDAIWEAGVRQPSQASLIKIQDEKGDLKISGDTYLIKDVRGANALTPVGYFESTGSMKSHDDRFIMYRYGGRERGSTGGPKDHQGVGFYQFYESAGVHKFTGGFMASIEEKHRRVEGRKLAPKEIDLIASSPRAILQEFLGEIKSQADSDAFHRFEDTFSEPLAKTLEENGLQFELRELKDVWGRNPLCMALLLRAVLEKVLVKAFEKNGRRNLIEDKNNQLLRLDDIIKKASETIIRGKRILPARQSETAQVMKLLGNFAAHYFSLSIDLQSIHHLVPSIKLALTDASRCL